MRASITFRGKVRFDQGRRRKAAKFIFRSSNSASSKPFRVAESVAPYLWRNCWELGIRAISSARTALTHGPEVAVRPPPSHLPSNPLNIRFELPRFGSHRSRKDYLEIIGEIQVDDNTGEKEFSRSSSSSPSSEFSKNRPRIIRSSRDNTMING